jgi:hypothetical protein
MVPKHQWFDLTPNAKAGQRALEKAGSLELDPIQAKFSDNRDSAETTLQEIREEGGGRSSPPANVAAVLQRSTAWLERGVRTSMTKGSSTKEDGNPEGLRLACSLLHDRSLDLSSLSLPQQVELSRFEGWISLHKTAASLGHAIAKLLLPPGHILPMLRSMAREDTRWISLSPGQGNEGLNRKLWKHSLGSMVSGSWVEYGPAGARESMQLTDDVALIGRQSDFVALATARECLKLGGAFVDRLDALSVQQWMQVLHGSAQAFERLMTMQITEVNEDKVFQLLSSLATDESLSKLKLDDRCRVAWSEGCDRAADTYVQWRDETVLPSKWARWNERNIALRRLSTGAKDPQRQLSSGVSSALPRGARLRTKSAEGIKQTAQKAALKEEMEANKAAAEIRKPWRSDLLVCCRKNPFDAANLFVLLEDLVSCPAMLHAEKLDLLQEEFDGRTVLEHVGDEYVERFIALTQQLQ